MTMIKHHRGLIQGNRVVDKLTCSGEYRLAIAWEDMKGIRERTTFKEAQRRQHHSWRSSTSPEYPVESQEGRSSRILG